MTRLNDERNFPEGKPLALFGLHVLANLWMGYEAIRFKREPDLPHLLPKTEAEKMVAVLWHVVERLLDQPDAEEETQALENLSHFFEWDFLRDSKRFDLTVRDFLRKCEPSSPLECWSRPIMDANQILIGKGHAELREKVHHWRERDRHPIFFDRFAGMLEARYRELFEGKTNLEQLIAECSTAISLRTVPANK